VPMDLDKYFLGQIVRVIVVNHHLADVPVDSFLILANKEIEPIVSGFGISYFT
jgi:hypothetical protein